MQVKEAMVPTDQLITVSPYVTVLEAMESLVVNRIGSLVITSEDSEVIGIITSRDLFQTIVAYENEGLTKTLQEIMSTKLLLVNENDLINTAVMKMNDTRSHHILVKNNDGKITGLLSSFDIVREVSWESLKIQ